MKTETFNQIRSIVYKESGISLGEHKLALVQARVNKRVMALKMGDPEEYLKYLTSEGGHTELVQLLDVISTNTTHFFRESIHFKFFINQLKEWHDQGQKKFRIWCAASSSGEEPYTLAMSMKEALGHDHQVDIKLLATDISTDILRKAKSGTYSEEKMIEVPKNLLIKYFLKIKKDGNVYYEASPALKNMISFKRLNLSTPPFPMKGPLDFIFCRNVMIYFDNIVRQNLIDDCYRLLKKNGYFIVGHSESLNAIRSSFKAIQPSVYLKP